MTVQLIGTRSELQVATILGEDAKAKKRSRCNHLDFITLGGDFMIPVHENGSSTHYC
jgi:hypothetical protein